MTKKDWVPLGLAIFASVGVLALLALTQPMRSDYGSIRRSFAKAGAETIQRVLETNTEVDRSLPDHRAEIATLLFEEPAPHSAALRLVRDDWTSISGNRIFDRYKNQFEITFDDAAQRWRVEVTRPR